MARAAQKEKKTKKKETDAGNATNVDRSCAEQAGGWRQKAKGKGRRQTGRMSIQWQAECFTGDGKGERQAMQHNESSCLLL